jgi:hypothetical protein
MAKTPKRPRDPNQLAKTVVDLATMDEGEREAPKPLDAGKSKTAKPTDRRQP